MSNVTDLDILVPEAKTVKLGGTEYVLPGDLPMEIFLRLNAASEDQEGNDNSQAVIRLLDAIGDLFAWDAPEDLKAERAEKIKGIFKGHGVKFLMEAIQNIYKPEDDDEGAADPEASPTEAATGTPSTTS